MRTKILIPDGPRNTPASIQTVSKAVDEIWDALHALNRSVQEVKVELDDIKSQGSKKPEKKPATGKGAKGSGKNE